MIRVGYKVVKQNLTSCMVQGKYTLHYPLGKVVNAVKGTLGIMIFDTYYNACDFVASFCGGVIILLVAYGVHDVTYANCICAYIVEARLDEYYNQGKSGWAYPPLGTILCRKVKVIAKEEVIPQ